MEHPEVISVFSVIPVALSSIDRVHKSLVQTQQSSPFLLTSMVSITQRVNRQRVDRQTDRQTESRQTDRQTEILMDRQLTTDIP